MNIVHKPTSLHSSISIDTKISLNLATFLYTILILHNPSHSTVQCREELFSGSFFLFLVRALLVFVGSPCSAFFRFLEVVYKMRDKKLTDNTNDPLVVCSLVWI